MLDVRFRMAKAKVVSVNKLMPTMAMRRGPWRSNHLPAMGFITPMRMAPGMSTRPDTVADSPWSDCT